MFTPELADGFLGRGPRIGQSQTSGIELSLRIRSWRVIDDPAGREQRSRLDPEPNVWFQAIL